MCAVQLKDGNYTKDTEIQSGNHVCCTAQRRELYKRQRYPEWEPCVLYSSKMGIIQKTQRSIVRTMCAVQIKDGNYTKDTEIHSENHVCSTAQRWKIARHGVDVDLK